MKSAYRALPLLLTVVFVLVMAWHGPIKQLAHYHEFADQTVWLGMLHAADVCSNLGFALVGLAGIIHLYRQPRLHVTQPGYPAYCVFVGSLLLTALGSSYYHLAPDDARLLWDRLPIALACGSLLAAVRADTRPGLNVFRELGLYCGFAVFSVLWWQQTQDLRPYLLLQLLALVLVPLWQTVYQSPRKDRIAFAAAMLLYVLAKLAELQDAAILTSLKLVSGHSLKHLLAAAAAALIVARLMRRSKEKMISSGVLAA